jgi:hypothetical protein
MSDTPERNETRERRGNERALLPILLIAAGVLLLLGRFDLFDWSLAFGILQLWPLLLIAVGVGILTGGRFPAVVVIATVAIGAVLWQVPAWSPFGGTAAEVRPIEYPLDGVRAAEVELRHGVGLLEVGALGRGDGRLVAGTLATGRGESVDVDYRVDDGVAELDLRSEQRGPSFGFDGGRDVRRWTLELARDLPIELTIDTGVGESRFALRDLTLSGLDLDAGVGEVRIELPTTGGYAADIDAGVGEVTVLVPSGVEASVEVETGLGGAEVEGSWTVEDGVYRTEGYASASAAERIELDVAGGVGQITIRRVD